MKKNRKSSPHDFFPGVGKLGGLETKVQWWSLGEGMGAKTKNCENNA